MKKIPVTKSLVAWIGATLLCLATGAAVAHDHDHGHESATPARLTLKDGKKWPTDAALRQGMERIRAAATRNPPLAPARMAAQVNEQIAYLVSNCNLDKDADAMLHLVLADLIAAADILRERPADRERGVAKISQALQDYASHFEHPGW